MTESKLIYAYRDTSELSGRRDSVNYLMAVPSPIVSMIEDESLWTCSPCHQIDKYWVMARLSTEIKEWLETDTEELNEELKLEIGFSHNAIDCSYRPFNRPEDYISIIHIEFNKIPDTGGYNYQVKYRKLERGEKDA